MINWNLMTPRNIAVVGAMAIAFHMLVKPLYGLIGLNGNNGSNS